MNQTDRFYLFENLFTWKQHIERPMPELQALARRVWREHGGERALPKVVAGQGLRHTVGEPLTSCYALEENRIELARQQRSRVVLLHELTHALHPRTSHGPVFVRAYFKLLEQYAGYNAAEMLFKARSVGVKV